MIVFCIILLKMLFIEIFNGILVLLIACTNLNFNTNWIQFGKFRKIIHCMNWEDIEFNPTGPLAL